MCIFILLFYFRYDALNLDTALMECKAALDLFFNNRFDEARLLLSPG